jgi:hypothetical protein
MPTIQIEVELSSAELLRSAEQLNPLELEEFVTRLLALQAERRAPRLSRAEAELLQIINRATPVDAQQRFDELNRKRRSETLTEEEQNELLQLIDQMEAYDVQRVEALSELARLRQISLKALMEELHIRTPAYV